MRPLISLAVLLFGSVGLFVLVRWNTKRRRSAAEIRDSLDPRTAQWLAARSDRREGATVRDAHGGIVATSNLEQPPVGVRHVRAVFDYTPGGNERGSIVAADAYCGPVEFVAVTAMPEALMKMWEPGFTPMPAEMSPAGWSLAVGPGGPDAVPVDSPALQVLRSITPPGSLPGSQRDHPGVDDAPEDILSSVKKFPGAVRVYFAGDSLYLMVGGWRTVTGWRIRDGAIQVAEYLATRLPQAPPPPPPPPPRPERAT